MIRYFYLTHRRNPYMYFHSRGDLRTMVMKGYSPKFQDLNFTIRRFGVILRTLAVGAYFLQTQSAYSTASDDCLLRIIVSYLKPSNSVQTNDYY